MCSAKLTLQRILITICSLYTFSKGEDSSHTEICGQKPVGKCFVSCHSKCQSNVKKANMDSEEAIERVNLERNICDNTCFGNRYSLQEINGIVTKRNLPRYDDFSKCLGPCAYPHAKQCLTGYLLNFFHCSCHSCCLNMGREPKSCAYGCYLWFMKKSSPNPKEGCRFRSDYAKTPHDWCRAFCTWKFTQSRSLSVTEAKNAMDTHKGHVCLSKCVGIVKNNGTVDFDTVVESCNEPWRCVNDVQATRFVIETPITSATLNSFTDMLPIDASGHYSYNMTHVFNHSGGTSGYYSSTFNTHRLVAKWPTALENMNSLEGFIFTGSDPNGSDFVTAPNDQVNFFNLTYLGYLFSAAYNSTPERVQSYQATLSIVISTIHVPVKCAYVESKVFAKYKNFLDIRYEVYVKLSSNGFITLTADEIKSAVEARNEWRDLTFVRILDEYSIEMKGRATAIYSSIFDTATEYKCSGRRDCRQERNHGKPDCRCVDKCKNAIIV